jgi:hypothetical protein
MENELKDKMHINHIRRFWDQIILMLKVGKWLQCSHHKQIWLYIYFSSIDS